MSKPVVSIVMPLYNAELFVEEAVKSILNQTFADFELIIVNDGSTDSSFEKVKAFPDKRIRLYENDANRGIVYTRNRGIELATGSFIAPFDADDVARADKFEKQLKFLGSNPEFGMIGSWARHIDAHGKPTGKNWKVNAPPERIPAILLFRNYFVQSSVVIRREAIPAGAYKEGFDIIEDYRMWIDVAARHRVWNYPDYLVDYRQHSGGITTKESVREDERSLRLIRLLTDGIGLEKNAANEAAMLNLKSASPLTSVESLKSIENLLMEVLEKNRATSSYDQKELTIVVYNRWLKACYKARAHHLKMMKAFITSPLQNHLLRLLT